MKKLLSFCLILFTCLTASPLLQDSYEELQVGKITVNVKNAPPSGHNIKNKILTEMELKVGDKFSQEEFDQDLKNLSNKYQTVNPVITKENDKINIALEVSLRPMIVNFEVTGTKYATKKILDKGNLKAPMAYNRGEFYQSITDIRDFLIKRGYFKTDVSYNVEEVPGTNEAIVHITIDQGPLGHINNIEFVGFTKKEESAVYGMIKSSKFNLLTNWLNGSGVVKDHELDRDEQIIIHYVQNEGYADAKVKMTLKKSKNDKVDLIISLDRGTIYHVNKVQIEGNTLADQEDLDDALDVKKGDVFSTEKIYATQEQIKSLYTEKGYLETTVDFELVPNGRYTYKVVFNVEESEKYKVGLIVVSGNKRTNNNVIYNNINITPGEVFDSKKMKNTQQRLESTGFFKNVSVYPVQSDHSSKTASKYRDIVVEVEEDRTGSFHVSAGANSTESVYGEVSIGERNFDIGGLATVWTDGVNALRGGGQYFDVKAMIAAKEMSGTVSWVNPYMNDSLWMLGSDIQVKKSNIIENYNLYSFGGGLSTTYPVNQFLSAGMKWRIKDSIIRIKDKGVGSTEEIEAQLIKQQKNGGIVSGGSFIAGYNSTNNPYVPRSGFKSNFQAEFAGLIREQENLKDFPFLKFNYLNAFYYPISSRGTIKLRGDAQFIQPLWGGVAEDFPLTEKFFLGGIGSLRGYNPGQVGPSYKAGDPKGGLTSVLFNVEYAHKVFQPIDVFTFFDTGTITEDPFTVTDKYYMSTGVGLRMNIGQPLPFVIGWGYPINPDNQDQVQSVFFSMAGTF